MTIKVMMGKEMAAVDEMIRRTREAFVQDYRDAVWAIFNRILEQTPQFTGRAVAHWDIQVDGNTSYYRHDYIGKVVNPNTGRHKKDGTFYKQDAALRRGDQTYIEVAKARNFPKLALIRRESVVRFTNNVEGDNDNGASSTYYMQALQEPTYWAAKLRHENKPYETAQESIAWEQFSHGGSKGSGVYTFRRTRLAIGKV